MDEFSLRVDELARASILLVASDFDGTLAPMAPDPAHVSPCREAVVALHALAMMAQTHVAVISGRALRDLAALSGLSAEVCLVGSHGSEFDPGFAQRLAPGLIDLRDLIRDDMEAAARGHSGFLVEVKPASVALHYRLANELQAAQAVERILHGPARRPGVHLKRGKKVIELSVVPTDKGRALSAIRHRVGATAAMFLGDDDSDEDAFATLCGPDVGVKVGDGPTRAPYRVDDTTAAARVLSRLVEARESWLKGSRAVRIEAHSLLSDQRTAALVTPDSRVVWCCLPRIDSASIFAELLGGPGAGYFAVRSANGQPPARQVYDRHTFVLRTEWPEFHVTDFLDVSGGRAFQRAGRTDLVREIAGRGRIVVEFAPRMDFGREPTRLQVIDDGLRIEGSLDPIVLRSGPLRWQIVEEGHHHTAVAEHELDGRSLHLELRYGLSSSEDLVISPARRLEETRRFWTVWAEQLRLPTVAPDLVRRSALVLKALSYGPSGAISAAATTSLPEHVGGVRNWDYRYCWLRDAAMAATALARLGVPGAGVRLADWLLSIMDRGETPDRFRPLYTVTGAHLGVEADISELPGYRGSRPVRIGNGAAQQLQLDVFGPIMEMIAVLAECGAALSGEHWRLTEAIVNAVGIRWQEPDHGIWEVRRARRQYVHSKVMCWQAIDRALRIAQVFSAQRPPEWLSLRDRISADVLEHGWNSRIGAFTSVDDEGDLDAAALLVGLSGLLPGHDPRVASTVETVERTLRSGPTVYRYLFDDGLPGREGGFHLCTAWLVQALVQVGRLTDARQLFEQFTALFGPTGLAPEEYCPRSGESRGNHPQAYTHIGLIEAALALSSAPASRQSR